EYTNNADPHDQDTDDDFMPDGWEVDHNLAPLVADDGNDPDQDSHTNLGEYLHGSDPCDVNSVPTSTITITVPTEAGSIQSAVSLSIDGDVVEVLIGRYYESIDLGGKAITLTGSDPNDWWIVESTIIDANAASTAVVDFNDVAGANSVLTGLTLTNGEYGIACSNSSPTVSRCIVEDNNSHGTYCTSGSPLITNNIICLNGDDGIYSSSSSPPTVKNNWLYDNENGIGFDSATSAATVRNNTVVYSDSNGIYVNSGTAPTITNCILWDNDSNDLIGCSATYSCIEHVSEAAGTGNICGEANDPNFIEDPNVDCRLMRDSVCKNAGTGTISGETDIEGHARDANGVDMGADEICEVHNQTQDVWYESIQHAIDDANSNDNDVIVVYEWTFNETINFDGNSITVRSTDPNDWDVVAATIIDADDSDANVVTFDSGEDANSILLGLTITGGKTGVFCESSSSPTIKRCFVMRNDSTGIKSVSGSPLIVNNKIGENGGDGIYTSSATPPTIKINLIYKNDANGIAFAAANSAATVRNNGIVDNGAAGIDVASGITAPTVSNCVLWGNDSNDLVGCSGTYCCIEHVSEANGTGNIVADPMHVYPDANNYNRDSCSPLVDAADPCQDYTGDTYLQPMNFDSDPDIGPLSTNPPRYVDADAPGYNDGSSWEDAFLTLQDALADGPFISGDEIWVAQGVYKPAGPGDRDATFELVEGLVLKGGFAGSPENPGLRDIEVYETVLSGDIDDDNLLNNGNSYHVVTADNPGIDGGTVLEGFTIQDGYAADGQLWDGYGAAMIIYDVSPAIRKCTFKNNRAKYGGGMSNWYEYAGPTVTDCVFKDNEASEYGGAIDNTRASPHISNCSFINNEAKRGGAISTHESTASPTITNCVLHGNSATQYGGGMYYDWCSGTVINCTFSNNTAGYGNSVSNSFAADPEYTNCIMWNDSETGDEVDNFCSSPAITYCDIRGGYPGTGNKNADPKFVAASDLDGPDNKFGTADDGLAIDCGTGSPCVDAGNDGVSGLPTTDIIGNKRETGNGEDPQQVDMGAYEALPALGHWKLDETTGNVADNTSFYETGYDNDGDFQGDPVWKTGGGVIGGALQFDPDDDYDDYVSIRNGGYYSTNDDFTWAAWMRTLDQGSLTNGGVIIAHAAGSGASEVKSLYIPELGNDSGKLKFLGGASSIVSTRRVDDGLWHHVAVTVKFDGSSDVVKLYIDGELACDAASWQVTDTQTSNVLKIGYANADFPADAEHLQKYFKGRIDDVRFYDYVLDEDYQQVAKLFEETGYWRFVATGDSRDDDRESRRDPDDREPGSYDGVNNNRLAEIANAIIAERAELVLVT
ncbi:MAG: right-handed parallel beta-helix repeat-containing protein, partial [Planctomycetota bacterium]